MTSEPPTRDEPVYEIEFYEDEAGNEPALIFMRSLSKTKRTAIGVAINQVLAYLGQDVCDTDYGKNLGGGLFEFRLRHDAEEILRKAGKDSRPQTEPEKILLRVFCHAYGNKIVLLLSGYDKAEHPSKSYQNTEIEVARGYLKDWERKKSKG